MIKNYPFVSIIVPVYNSATTLDSCISALKGQTYPHDKIEIIIVDNNSTDDSVAIAKRYGIHLEFETEVQTSYAARNRGIKIAQGELLAFTDADCVAAPDWIECLAVHWNDKEVGCFAGEINACAPETLIERFSCDIGLLRQKGAISGWHHKPYAQTANAAYRSSVFDSIGTFRGDMTSGGDADFTWRMLNETGFQIKFIPEAVVWHHHRVDIAGLFSQFRRYGGGKVSWRKYHSDYLLPKREEEEEEIKIAFIKALVAMSEAAVSERDVIYPFLSAVTKVAHFIGFTESEISEGMDSGTGQDEMEQIACNICGNTHYVPGPQGRLSHNKPPMCADCGSLERHRILRNFWCQLRPIIGGFKVLQFAKDVGLNPDWVETLEYSVFGGQNSLNLLEIARPSSNYHCVIANHVLEHVLDDIAAIREMLRVVGPHGIIQVTVPSPNMRLFTDDYGQPDPSRNGHYRVYGSDFADHVTRAFPLTHLLQVVGRDPVTGVNDVIYVLSVDADRIDQISQLLKGGGMLSLINSAPLKYAMAQVQNHYRVIEKSIPKFEIKQKHIQHTQLLVNRSALLERLPQNAMVAEVGVDQGEFSQKILQLTKPKKLHLIDVWASERYNKSKQQAVEKKYENEINEGIVELNLGLSTQVVHQFKEQYFDWVYIDTDHSYKTTISELESYSKKVKAEGLIAGHDFCVGNWNGLVRYGVIEAVYEFCVKFDWEIIYLTMEVHGHSSFAIRRINPSRSSQKASRDRKEVDYNASKKYESELIYWRERERVETKLSNSHYQELMLMLCRKPCSFFYDKIVGDFGCGPRGSLEWMKAYSSRLICIDVLVDDYMQFGIKEHQAIYVKSSEEVIPLSDGYLDVLFAINSIDHVDDIDCMIGECLRILRPGGLLAMSINIDEPATKPEPNCITSDYVKKSIMPHLDVENFVISNRFDGQNRYQHLYEWSRDGVPPPPYNGSFGICWLTGTKP